MLDKILHLKFIPNCAIFEFDFRIALSTSMINIVCCLNKMADSGIKSNREKHSNTIFDLTVHAKAILSHNFCINETTIKKTEFAQRTIENKAIKV